MNMQKTFYSFICLLLIGTIFVPDLAHAFEISFESPEKDKSIYYLGLIFGPMGTALPHGVGNALLSSLFSIFNIAVLTLGSIVVSYTIVLSTINTAQEGEVMGRKWSSIWIPIRSALGVSFLIPTASGYSILQIMMMSIVVYGIGAANQLWKVVVDTFSSTSGTGFAGTVTMKAGTSTSTKNLLKASVCQYVLNTDTACRNNLGNKYISLYIDPNNRSNKYMGVQSTPADPLYAQVCGSSIDGALPTNVYDQAAWQSSNFLALDVANNLLSPTANEIATAIPPSTPDVIFSGMSAIRGALSSAMQKPTNLSGANLQAYENGWIYAGSYYFVMISNNNRKLEYAPPNVTGPNATQIGNLNSSCREALNRAIGPYYNNYMTELDKLGTTSASGTSYEMSLPNVSGSEEVGSIMSALADPLRKEMTKFMKELTTGDPRGPIPSLARIGTNVLNLAEDIWLGVMTIGALLLVIACVMSGIQPFCWAVGVVITLAVPILSVIIGLLWVVGGMIGIYLPLVPYLVFTFTALGWIVLVIETIVAAPIVALGLVSPAGEHLGKAAPAVMLVVNVFLRPSLMVIGFVIGAKLVDAAIGMLNYGFFATVEASVKGLGIFGTIALLTLYGGVAITIIHECFSLIHILPDKIIRWLGGQAEQSQVKQQLAEAKKSVDKGSEIGAGVMKGSAGFIGDKAGGAKDDASKQMSQDGKDGKDGKDGSSGSDGIQSGGPSSGPGTGGGLGGAPG